MKKGFELSFGFIFSLIIVAVVIFVGIWGVKKILEFSEGNRIRLSIEEIQTTVEEIWPAHEANITEKDFYFPSSVKAICFINNSKTQGLPQHLKKEVEKYSPFFSKYNLFVIPFELKNKYRIQGYYNITCGKVQCLEFESFCVENKDGKIKISFESVDGKVRIKP